MTRFSPFRLETPICWYQQDTPFLNFCDHLRERVAEGSPPQYLCIHAPERLFDETEAWAAELQETEFRGKVLARIQTFQKLLALIRISPVPIVFIAGESLTGTAWELAMACTYRITSNPDLSPTQLFHFVAQSGEMAEVEAWLETLPSPLASGEVCKKFCELIEPLEAEYQATSVPSSIPIEWLALASKLFQPGAVEALEKKAHTYTLQPLSISSTPPSHKTLRIRLSLQGPPLKALELLLTSGWHCVFFHEEPSVLASRLGQLYIKLAEELGPIILKPIWAAQVRWFSSEASSALDFIHWQADDIFFMQVQGKTSSFLRWEGNALRSEMGWCEPLTSREDLALFLPLLAATGQCALPKQIPPLLAKQPFAWSEWIRSLFLQEIVLSGFFAAPVATLGLLERGGWGFVSRQERWVLFLQTRTFPTPFPDAELTPLTSASCAVTSWKELLNWVQIPAPQTQASSIYICSSLLASLCGLLLQRKGVAPTTADVWVTDSLGLPKKAPAPSRFLRQLGRARALAYTERFWPQWLPLVREYYKV